MAKYTRAVLPLRPPRGERAGVRWATYSFKYLFLMRAMCDEKAVKGVTHACF